jgi:hypothetical protein
MIAVPLDRNEKARLFRFHDDRPVTPRASQHPSISRGTQYHGDIDEHRLSIDANVEFSTPLLQFQCTEPAGRRQSQIYAFIRSWPGSARAMYTAFAAGAPLGSALFAS